MKVKFRMNEMLIVPETEVEESWIRHFYPNPTCFVKHGASVSDLVGILIRQPSKTPEEDKDNDISVKCWKCKKDLVIPSRLLSGKCEHCCAKWTRAPEPM